MPSVIPYDPSLVLGNLVRPEALANLSLISAIQAPIDAAEDTLNDAIATKRSIDMTIDELINMDINDNAELLAESKSVGESIKTAAVQYAKIKIAGLTQIQALKAKILGVHDEIESPIDYNKTQIKTMPLAADSLKMNVQYFGTDQNDQNSTTTAATIKSFVSGELSYFGDTFKNEASSSVQSQANSQYQNHSISGTLVISITCTHKDALLLAPFILDVDKGIRAWNRIYPDDMIKTNDPAGLAEIMVKSETPDENHITLLSGVTYGSCFIGMVHILDTTETKSSETMYSVAESMQGQFEVGGWFADVSGGFGVDSSFTNDAKNLLSSQNITSHCSLVTMGSIPSIKSNEVAMGVKQFANFDGEGAMKQIAALQNATAGDLDTIGQSATAARTGQQMLSMKSSQVQSVLAGLADIQEKANKMLDINSMMDAMDDYIQKALAGNIGVPINYYQKPITKSQLAKMFMSKYYPNKFQPFSGDDSTPTPPAPAP